jgi:acetylornithine deacetylase/succinyl-diaminopimelate desuccinylase-like protein
VTVSDISTRGEEAIELLVEMIRNSCVNDGTVTGGHEHRSVATLQAYFGHSGTVVEPQPGRQSVVYRVPGTGGGPALLLLPHLDVVPASGAAWTHDPFAGVRADGFVYGRGAVDMLNVTAAMAVVFKSYLVGAVEPLSGDLIFAGVADEEAGGQYGAAHLVEEHWDLVACDYVLTEVAAPSFPAADGPVLPVTVAEKGPAWRKMTTRGLSGHGSQPYGTSNALTPLAEALAKLAAAPTPVDITEDWHRFVTGLGLDTDLEHRLLDEDLVDDAIADLAVEDPAFARWVHACTHLTITPTMLDAGVKMNVVPEFGEGFVDVRKLPGQDEAAVDDHFRKVLGPALYDEIDFEPFMEFPATSSSASGPLWDAIGDAAEDLTGSRTLVPAITPVGTDARFFRARGIPGYGVGLFDDRVTFAEMLAMFHGDDERVSERSVDLTTQMLAATMNRFGSRTAH